MPKYELPTRNNRPLYPLKSGPSIPSGAGLRYFRRNKGMGDYISVPLLTLSASDVVEITFKAPDSAINSNQFLYDGGISDAGLLLNSSGRINVRSGWVDSIYIDGVSSGEINPIFPTDGKLHAIKVFTSAGAEGFTITNLCSDSTGNNNYSGVIFDFKITRAEKAIHLYPISDNATTIRDIAGGKDGTIIGGSAGDWGLFQEHPTLWKGQGLTVPPWDSVSQELIKA